MMFPRFPVLRFPVPRFQRPRGVLQPNEIGLRLSERRATNIGLLYPKVRNIQLYSPECTLAENINISNNKQNKDRNILINTVQLNTRYTFVNVLTKDINIGGRVFPLTSPNQNIGGVPGITGGVDASAI